MHLASGLAYDEDGDRNFYWSDDTHFLELETASGHTIHLGMLTQLAQDSMLRAEMLLNNLFSGFEIKKYAGALTGRIEDDFTSYAPGYSCLSDRRNKLDQLHLHFLQHLMTHRNPAIRLSYRVADGAEDGLHLKNMKTFALNSEKLLETLAVLIHVTSGQPARAAEMAVYKIANMGPENNRSLYFKHGTIALQQRYHKGRNITGHDKNIARYLPKAVANVLMKYLVFIRYVEM